MATKKRIKIPKHTRPDVVSPVDDETAAEAAAVSTAERVRPDAVSPGGDSSTAEVIMRGAPAVRDQRGDYRNDAAPFIKNPVAWMVEKNNDKKPRPVPAENISNIRQDKNLKYFYENGRGISSLQEFQKQHVVSGSIRKELNCFGQGSKVLDIINPDWPVMRGMWIFKQGDYYFGYSVLREDIVPEKIWWTSENDDTHCDLYASDPSQAPLQHLNDINLNKVKKIFKHMNDCECDGNYPNDTASLHIVCNFQRKKKGISVFSYLENIITETHGDDMGMSAQVDLVDDDMDATKNLTDDMNKEAREVLTGFYSHGTIYNGKLLDKEFMCDHHAIINGTELSDTALCYQATMKPEIQKARGLKGHYDCNEYIVAVSKGGNFMRYKRVSEGEYKRYTLAGKMIGDTRTVEEINKVCNNDCALVGSETAQSHRGLRQAHVTLVDDKVLSIHRINSPYLKGIKSKYATWSKLLNITSIKGCDGKPVSRRLLEKLINLLPAKMESTPTRQLAQLLSQDINTSCEKHSKYVESNKTSSDGGGGNETGDELEDARSEDGSTVAAASSSTTGSAVAASSSTTGAAAGDDTDDSNSETEDEKDIPDRNVTKKTEQDSWDNIHGDCITSKCPLCDGSISSRKGKWNSCVYGHIQSVNKWGADNQETRDGVTNIMPICRCCNANMKDKHLMKYVEKRWPDYAEKFKESYGELVNLEY